MVEQLTSQSADSASKATPPLHHLAGYHIKKISRESMQAFGVKWHYNLNMPRQTKLCFGGFRHDDSDVLEQEPEQMKAAICFGWGSRPLHTIRALFPSLTSKDYLDIGKMCLEDAEPKNSESYFLSRTVGVLKKERPELKVLFTWADGMWGKPGYIYQASNFLYGGFIWTDVYMTRDGKRLHPLQLQSERRSRGLDTKLRTQRPSLDEQQEMGWKHYFGKQFRYIRFLCSEAEKEKLLAESPFKWGREYPKNSDCEWKIQTAAGRSSCPKPDFVSAVRFKK